MDEYKIDFSRPEYKGTLKEETEKIEEMVDNEEVAGIIAKLRDESFGNEEQRKKMVDLLTSLMMCKDASARKLFKMVGSALSDIGSSLLGDNESEYENDMGVEEVVVEPEMIDEPMEMDYEEDPYRGPLVIQRYESKVRDNGKLEENKLKDLEASLERISISQVSIYNIKQMKLIANIENPSANSRGAFIIFDGGNSKIFLDKKEFRSIDYSSHDSSYNIYTKELRYVIFT